MGEAGLAWTLAVGNSSSVNVNDAIKGARHVLIRHATSAHDRGQSATNVQIAFSIDFVPDKIPKMKRENPQIEICPGITRRTVANGKTMYQMIATLVAGSRMPAHSHPQEQIVHILEGEMRLIVDGVPHELSTGDSFYLASNIPHGVETVLPTRVLDTFSPPRDDYLAMDRERMESD
jgi:quercetin dioxygenase-like cupin family protein